MDSLTVLFSTFVAVVASLLGGLYVGNRKKGIATKDNSQEVSQEDNSQKEKEILEAKTHAKELVLEARDEALKIKAGAEEELKKVRISLAEAEKNLEMRAVRLDHKETEAQERERVANEKFGFQKKRLEEIEELKTRYVEKLEKASGLTKEEAKKVVLDAVEHKLSDEVAKKVREMEESIKKKSDVLAKEIILEAMHSAASDYVAEYTVSKLKLSDPEIKGRIIGKEGRNIKAFEEATGVNLDMDEETSSEVRLSCFDPVRREIARLSLERLVADGRIQPARIEEVVEKTRSEIERIILKEGENLCARFNIYNLPKEVVALLGRYKYRFSYGQNMIEHTIEETKMGVKIANELGIDSYKVKMACLLHDIGKVLTDEEGNHIELGANLLRKYKFDETVIKAVAEHHTDKPSTVEGVIVQIADSISGARPGARYTGIEDYVKRMKDLEEVALSFKGVEKAFAISAGRELRVIVKPEEVGDEKLAKLAFDIAQKIEKEQTYPGTIKVLAIRDFRVSEIAK